MTTPTTQLTQVRVEGFRSIKDATVDLGPINVLIGPNGSGKSNLLTALRLPSIMRAQGLRLFVGKEGGASRLLHYGAETTKEFEIDLTFTEDSERWGSERWGYEARLGQRAGESLVFVKELLSLESDRRDGAWLDIGKGHLESQMARAQGWPHTLSRVEQLVGGMGFFHFHNTSSTSPLRQNARQADSKYLHSDGSNLAALLYRLKRSAGEDARVSWSLLEGLVRRVAPFIKTLDPDLVDPDNPDASSVRLHWTDERNHRFDAHDLSDGTLRSIALFAALTQPPSTRPAFITIDEPELGLHPAAISLFAALVRSASAHSQILLATQSPALLDEFATDEIVVVERAGGETSFTRLDPKQLEAWLEDYSLSELYDKNVLGGRP
ncbi:MAG: AAA family ATPase [Polyangiaceae bacterium]|nr:AAA family ATPase [Polyangiaceae bacterium]